ncbi:MAG TPA: VOC family protein [Acidimicrobiales bacterium]|nr:VOC family protein [Acidimicrobiales bacterium]
MGLHRLASITIGVPNVEDTCRYYAEFGLARDADRFSTTDGGEQLRIVASPSRRLVEMVVGADDPDDLDRVTARLATFGVTAARDAVRVSAVEANSGVRVVVHLTPRISQTPASRAACNGPGRPERVNDRAPGIRREGPVRPRKLGHVVVGTPEPEAVQRFFVHGVGFKISDEVPGVAAFLRCSTDHHNLLIQPSPVAFLHHTSWQVDDVDEVGRGAMRMLGGHPERHTWGLGRHFIGSNFFWYLRDPAGNFSEYYSDMDIVTDDQTWTPGTWEPSLQTLYAWGPDVPASMLAPDDLAELMAVSHRP